MSELMSQGLNLALVGMGVVFTFLAVLVFLTTLMSDLVARLPGSDAPSEGAATGGAPPRSGQSESSASTPDDTQLIAVISAAIREHRRRR